jgi:hypothetical protein
MQNKITTGRYLISPSDMWQSLQILERLTNQNCIHEETKNKLNFGIAYYHSVQSPFAFLPPT